MVKEELIYIDDYQVRCNIWGEENACVIVCLHGLGNSSLSFIEVAEKLKEEYKIISIDLPGHGKSEKFRTEQEYDMQKMATWLLKVMKKLDIDKFHLLAHSYGADIALHFIKEYKSHVKKTILVDGGYTTKEDFYKIVDELAKEPDWKWPNINDVKKEIEYTSKYYNSFEFPSWESFFESEAKSNKNWNHYKKVASSDYVIEENGKIKLIVDPNVAEFVIKSMANSPIKEVYKQIDSDILILVATLPEEFNIINDKLLEDIMSYSKVMIKRIKDSTHMLHWDKPEVVIDEIRRHYN